MSLASGQGGKGASVLEALFYWCRSAAGEKGGYEVVSVARSSLAVQGVKRKRADGRTFFDNVTGEERRLILAKTIPGQPTETFKLYQGWSWKIGWKDESSQGWE